MDDRWEDEYGCEEYDDDDFDCDCMEEEIDILEGTAHCWRCGNRRVLGSEEFKKRMDEEARHQEAYDEEMRRLDRERD